MRWTARLTTGVALGGCLGLACNSDEVGADDEAGESSGDTGEAAAGSARVSLLEINPGVPIPLVVDGEPVPAYARAGQIPRGRPALIRVHLDVSDDWTPRELELRLALVDGPVQTERIQAMFVASDTDPGDPVTSFDFELDAADVSPGLELALELDDAASKLVRLPEQGTYAVGVEDDALKIRLMLVPIAYDSGNCVSDATPSPEERIAFGNAIVQNFPVQTVELSVRADPVPWKQELDGNWAGLLQKLLDLRKTDQIPPDMYYVGLVDFCDEDPYVSAVAAGFPTAGPEAGDVRVAISSKYPTPQGGGGINGFLFGLGVLHGRLTVPCATGAGLDEGYPYEGGSIGGWGYGIVDGELKDPAQYVDLVAGCMSPTRWVSDYTWRGLYERVRAITSWGG